MDISIIIPVYKTEEYLEECVKNILVQDTQDIEVILVDDGSPDNCPQICDKLMRLDSRIRVVHKSNGGLSSARNAGLTIATGKYVTFVDSDDKIFPSSIKDILSWSRSESADICFLKTLKLYPDGTQKDMGEDIEGHYLKAQNRDDAIKYLASRPKYPGSAWGKLFRRDFLIAHDLHFPYDRRYSEDLGFVRDCIMCANSFDALDIPYYQYRQNREGSITNRITYKSFDDLMIFITESVEKLTTNKKVNDSVSASIMSFVAYEYIILLHLYASLPKTDKRTALNKLKALRWTLRYTRNKKWKIVSLICSFFGVRFTSVLIKQYKKSVEK